MTIYIPDWVVTVGVVAGWGALGVLVLLGLLFLWCLATWHH